MKYRLIILITLLNVAIASAQYNRWSLDVEYGKHRVLDESAITDGNTNHAGLGIKYSLNPYAAIGVTGGFDQGPLEDINGLNVDLNYSRANLETFINIFNLLHLQNRLFTVVAHGGPGIANINTNTNYNQNIFNLRYGISGLIRISNRLSLKADYSSSDNFMQSKTIDGSFKIGNTGVNSMVRNLSVGITVSLGRNGQDHSDWYKPKRVSQNVLYRSDTTIINHHNNEYITKQFVVADSICSTDEYIFFDNDSHEIREEALNPIYKIFTTLILVPEATLEITGWASATSDGATENMMLSQKRAETIKKKLLDMGIAEDRIAITANGKDMSLQIENVHDLARRVELIIVRNK